MIPKLKFVVASFLLLSMAVPALADGGGGESVGNQQSPIEIAVQIAITALILRIMSAFRLP